MIALIIVVAANQVFIVATGPTLTKRLKEVADRKPDRASATQDSGSRRSEPDNKFPGLGVVIRDEKVLVQGTTAAHALGHLSGAQAGIAEPVAFRKLGRVGTLAAHGFRPFAYVVFPDGTLHQSVLKDRWVAARAQTDVLRFNALAATKHSW